MPVNVCYPFVLDPTGGSFVSTKLLAENLKGNVRPRFVFTAKESAYKKTEDAGLDADIIPLNAALSSKLEGRTRLTTEVMIGLRLIPYFFRVRRYLRYRSIDIVHVNDGLTAIIWGIAAKSAGIHTIWHIRSERPNIWDAIRLCVCDQLIFVAESNKCRFDQSELQKIDWQIIHNGVDMSLFSESDKSYLHDELGLSEEATIVGSVGDLVARKRPDLFADAAFEVLQENEEIHFVMIGEDRGEFWGHIAERAQQRDVRENIHFLGYRNDVEKIMPSFDLLVLTSTEHGEAFPRAPLEAMASGTPVVTTDTAGVDEAVRDGKTGVVLGTDPAPSEIATTILSMLRDSSLIAEYSQNGIRNVEENFSSDSYAREVVECYSQVSEIDMHL